MKPRDPRSEIEPADRCPTMELRGKDGGKVIVNAAPVCADDLDPAAVRAHKRALAEHGAMLAGWAAKGFAPEKPKAAAKADKDGDGKPG